MAFRIMNITQHIEKQHHEILTALLQTTKATKTPAEEFESQVTLMVHSFRFELSDFLMGLSRLTENRLSPFLIRPAELVQAYTEMTAKAREAGLHPLTDDTGIMFQAEVFHAGSPRRKPEYDCTYPTVQRWVPQCLPVPPRTHVFRRSVVGYGNHKPSTLPRIGHPSHRRKTIHRWGVQKL